MSSDQQEEKPVEIKTANPDVASKEDTEIEAEISAQQQSKHRDTIITPPRIEASKLPRDSQSLVTTVARASNDAEPAAKATPRIKAKPSSSTTTAEENQQTTTTAKSSGSGCCGGG